MFGEWEVVTAPTCTEPGKRQHTCTLCGETAEEETLEPLGHDFGMWQMTKEATCSEPGIMVRVCSRCGEKEEREMAADESLHKYVRTVVRETSCYDDGLVEYICSICGAKDEARTEATPATGHNFVALSSKNPNEKTCTYCGLVVSKTDTSKEPSITVKDGAFTLVVDISNKEIGDVWLKVEEIPADSNDYKLLKSLIQAGHSVQNAYHVTLYVNGEKAEFTNDMKLSLTLDQALKNSEVEVLYMPSDKTLGSVKDVSKNKLEISFPASSLSDASNDIVVIEVKGERVDPSGNDDPAKPSDGNYNIAVPIIIISVAVVATGAVLLRVLKSGKGHKIDI